MLKYLLVKEKESKVRKELKTINGTLMYLSFIKIFIYMFTMMGLLIGGLLFLIGIKEFKDNNMMFMSNSGYLDSPLILFVGSILILAVSLLFYLNHLKIVKKVNNKKTLKIQDITKIDKEIKEITINHNLNSIKISEKDLNEIIKNDWMFGKLTEMVNEHLNYKSKNDIPLIEKLKKANWLEKNNIKLTNE